jgi:outer membrane protein TolC
MKSSVALALSCLFGVGLSGAISSQPTSPPGKLSRPWPAQPLTLEDAVALAARNNETTGIAAARLERARAIRREAYSAFLPALTATGTYTRRSREVTRTIDDEQIVTQARNALGTTTVLEWPLFDARAFPVARSTDRNLEAQEQESHDLTRVLAFDVAEAYFVVLSAERLLEAARRRLGVAEAVVADAETRLEAGLASRNEYTRTDLERAQSRVAVTEAENAVRINRLNLGYLIGVEAAGPLEEPGPLFAGSRDPEALARIARQNRPDLFALERRAEAARLLAREPGLRFAPRLDASATYRTTNEPGLSGREGDWNAGAVLTWELFDGGTRSAQAAARRAEYRDLRLQADALRRRIGVEVQGAAADLDTAEAAVAQAEVQVHVALQNEEEVRVRFQEGLATALEQADATVSAFEAQAGLARQRFALYVAQLALLERTGGFPLAASAGAAGGAGAAGKPAP